MVERTKKKMASEFGESLLDENNSDMSLTAKDLS